MARRYVRAGGLNRRVESLSERSLSHDDAAHEWAAGLRRGGAEDRGDRSRDAARWNMAGRAFATRTVQFLARGCDGHDGVRAVLQFIFIPRVKQIIEERGAFPSKSMVAARAVREFDGDPRYTARLAELLSEFDAMFN